MAASIAWLDKVPGIELTTEEAEIARASKWWDRRQDIPIHNLKVSKELCHSGFKKIGQLIQLERMVPRQEKTWEVEGAHSLARRHPELDGEVLEVASIGSWKDL